MVSKSRLDDCHRMNQTLQADVARLKDTNLSLSSKYEDLAQRADDDARNYQGALEENRRLLASVLALQDDREELGAEVEKFRQLAQSTNTPLSNALIRRLENYAKSRPGCEFDPYSGTVSFVAESLFEPKTNQTKPQARAWLDALAALVNAPDAADIHLLVSGRSGDSSVKPVGYHVGDDNPRDLGADRAKRVLEVLQSANLTPSRIELAGPDGSKSAGGRPDEATGAKSRRIEIQLVRDSDAKPTPTEPAARP
jgi:chemotaxis protein MotB